MEEKLDVTLGHPVKRKTTFCEQCRDETAYCISETILKGKIKNTVYNYKGKEACCKECGSMVYVPEVNDYNLEALYGTYRGSLEKVGE